ncbi:MAG: prenyltransferase [Pseudomonadota bacterium]|nr:prenyltransferase [Pseudomonadota bacterium]
MNPLEPSQPGFANPFAKYLAATRPAFLSVTLVGALIGLGSVSADGLSIEVAKALLTVFFALVAHAGANVLNDYYDALNGSDAGNQARLFPFTGGSRFIQNGVLSLRQTWLFGYGLLAAVIPAGLWLTLHSADGLIWIGLAGLMIAWAYSAPPLELMARGVGEAAIVGGWLLVVLGTDFVQRGAFVALPLVAGVPFALLVAAILYLNQFPDVQADQAAGKRTLIVRLGPDKARWGYPLLVLVAYLWLALAVLLGALPAVCALGLAPAVLSFKACRQLLENADQPSRLTPAIEATIAAANFSGLLLALALALARWL